MKKIILMIALAFSIALNAQNVTTNGTILLDNATSRTRVVVDAFLNSSNQVHSLIESVGMSEGLTTNDVCAIVTATGNWEWTGPGTYIASASELPAEGSWDGETYFTVSDISWVDATPGLEHWDAFITMWQWIDEGGGLDWSTNSDFGQDFSHGEDADELTFDVNFMVGDLTFTGRKHNALGLARLTDIAPTVSNTVTKAYVEDLGIEAGISAETATNIAEAVGANLPYLSTETGGVVNGKVEIHGGIYVDDSSSSFSGETFFSNKVHVVDELVLFSEYNMSIGGKDLGMFVTGKSDAAIASADTTYRRTIGLTNLNQSVQYVNITDTSPTTLAITMPTDGATKDWMVYVVSVTNVTLSLPAATWWMADVAYTNDVPPATPTALWFSQVTDGIFILGRQELTEVTAP